MVGASTLGVGRAMVDVASLWCVDVGGIGRERFEDIYLEEKRKSSDVAK